MKWWRSRISIAPPICLPRSRAGWNQTPTSSLVNPCSMCSQKTGPRQTARGPELVRSYDNLRQHLSEDAREHLLERTAERPRVTKSTSTPASRHTRHAVHRVGLVIPGRAPETQAIRCVAQVQELVPPIHISGRRGQNLTIPPQLDGPPF